MDGYELYIPSRRIGLVYSPDDAGWYWQETYGDWLVSKLFATRDEAVAADEEDMCWN